MAWKKWNANFRENRTTGAFHSTKTSGLNFQQLPVANGAAFSKISKKEINLARHTIRGIGLLYEVSFFPEVFFPFNFAPGVFRLSVSAISEIQQFPEFLKLFRGISVPFDSVSKFLKVLVEWKAPSKALCFISAARYCFRNIDQARQVPHQFDVQPRIKLELQYVLTWEMKDFIAPWQIMAR